MLWWTIQSRARRKLIFNLRKEVPKYQVELGSLFSGLYRASACSRCGSQESQFYESSGSSIRVRCTGCKKLRWIKPYNLMTYTERIDELNTVLGKWNKLFEELHDEERIWSGGRAITVKEFSFILEEPPRLKPLGKRRTIPAETQRLVRDRDENRCVLCGSHENLHLDHIIPFSQGGGNQPENLRVLCQTCNLKKGAGIS